MIIDNSNQKWVKWIAGNLDLEGNYHTNQIVDHPNSFKILITTEDRSKNIEFLFNHSVWAYRRTSESFRQNVFKDLSLEYGTDFYANWSFFKVEDSDYIAWLNEESSYIADDLNLTHFVIMTLDDIVDVVANYEPEITIIDNE